MGYFNLKIGFLLEEIHKIKIIREICIYKIKFKIMYKVYKLTKDIDIFKMKALTGTQFRMKI